MEIKVSYINLVSYKAKFYVLSAIYYLYLMTMNMIQQSSWRYQGYYLLHEQYHFSILRNIQRSGLRIFICQSVQNWLYYWIAGGYWYSTCLEHWGPRYSCQPITENKKQKGNMSKITLWHGCRWPLFRFIRIHI